MQVLSLVDARAADVDRLRCAALAAFLNRGAAQVAGQASKVDAQHPTDALTPQALHILQSKGLLSFARKEETVEVFYMPSRGARQAVMTDGDLCGFPGEIHAKQRDAFRRSEGALFRFPVDAADSVPLEVFITDWSPCPAAAAIAVHPSHPFVAAWPKLALPCFAGQYVRHPLTGDLLPVWVADWVKPDFGTGAVLVNPAHSKMDLAFGRQVGLPIRFALVPSGCSDDPMAWPYPPVIKTGQAIRTGAYDGLPAAEAAARYFDVLASRGLAERYTDLQVGGMHLGNLGMRADGPLRWDDLRLQMVIGSNAASVSEEHTKPAVLQPAALLETALQILPGARLAVVSTAAAAAKELLFLRLLRQDLEDSPLKVAEVWLTQRVQGVATDADPAVLELACLAAAPVRQVAVLKQGLFDQVRRFLRLHDELVAGAEAGAGGEADPRAAAALTDAKAAIVARDPFVAFTKLYAFQKQPGASSQALRKGYFALANVAFGLPTPAGFPIDQGWSMV